MSRSYLNTTLALNFQNNREKYCIFSSRRILNIHKIRVTNKTPYRVRLKTAKVFPTSDVPLDVDSLRQQKRTMGTPVLFSCLDA